MFSCTFECCIVSHVSNASKASVFSWRVSTIGCCSGGVEVDNSNVDANVGANANIGANANVVDGVYVLSITISRTCESK